VLVSYCIFISLRSLVPTNLRAYALAFRPFLPNMQTVLARNNAVKVLVRVLWSLHADDCGLRHYIHHFLVRMEEE
jgi:hypothetical protein